jgi:hypothetical protein
MAIFADDDVIVHGDAERRGDVDDGLGHRDIRLRGCRIATRVVVHETIITGIRLRAFSFLQSDKRLGTSIGDCKL